MSDSIYYLQQGIEDRQDDLRRYVQVLGRKGYQLQKRSNSIKVVTIIMSALSTAKGVADKLYGSDNRHTLIIFTVTGLFTTVMLGFEAAFRLEKRAIELSVLSASAQATVIRANSDWLKNVASLEDTSTRAVAAKALISVQDAKLEELHEKAASNGIVLSAEEGRLDRGTAVVLTPNVVPYGDRTPAEYGDRVSEGKYSS